MAIVPLYSARPIEVVWGDLLAGIGFKVSSDTPWGVLAGLLDLEVVVAAMVPRIYAWYPVTECQLRYEDSPEAVIGAVTAWARQILTERRNTLEDALKALEGR